MKSVFKSWRIGGLPTRRRTADGRRQEIAPLPFHSSPREPAPELGRAGSRRLGPRSSPIDWPTGRLADSPTRRLADSPFVVGAEEAGLQAAHPAGAGGDVGQAGVVEGAVGAAGVVRGRR